jgi:CRISPR-associated protein Cas1
MINKRSLCIQSAVYLSVSGKQLIINYRDMPPQNNIPDGLSAEEIKQYNRYFPIQDNKVPLDDIAVIIADNPATSYSAQLLSKLAEYNIALIVCDNKHLPVALLVPFHGYHAQTKILYYQVAMKIPLKKRLWQTLVIAKIEEQARCILKTLGNEIIHKKLMSISNDVVSGDITNQEALAARIYWEHLFGDEFERSKTRILINKNITNYETDIIYNRNIQINTCLNYGYTIIRALVIRAIVSVGLNPTLGLFHRNQFNNFCLADDLMEPVRGLVDTTVWHLDKQHQLDLKYAKPILINLVHTKIWFENKQYPLMYVIQKFAERLRDAIIYNTKFIVPNFTDYQDN